MKTTTLQEIIGSHATSAYERLIELQDQGITVEAIPFTKWPEECKDNNDDTRLIPKLTKYFADGWDRYTGLVTPASMKPELELYVAGHNAVYAYSLDTNLNLIDLLESLKTV